MNRGWYLRLLFVLGVVGAGLYMLYPSFVYYTSATEEQRESRDEFCRSLPTWSSCKVFNLGLDLQGGVHLVMGVRVEKAIENRADRIADALREALKERSFDFARIDRPKDASTIRVTLAPNTSVSEVEALLRKDFSVLELVSREDRVLTLDLLEEEKDYVAQTAVDQAISTIRNRADKLGVTEPTIAKRGTDSVLIQLPGVKDPERAIDIIGRTAQLEFKIVDVEATAVFDDIPDEQLPAGVTRKQTTTEGPGGATLRDVYFELPEGQKAAVSALLSPKIPGNREIAFGTTGAGATPGKPGPVRTYVLHSRPGITGDYLTDASPQQNPDLPSEWYVSMSFDLEGAKIFERLTEENVKRHMAIVLDGVVNSAPVINEKIGGGRAQITLGRGGDARRQFQESKDLALVLKAGALPAPVEIREKRQVGRTLGDEAVRKGSVAFTVGALLVVVFMIIYYRLSGVVADIALVVNMTLLLAVLALFEATLTLPGMAGIVLTIGMAVDANVIIFERIREELASGKPPRAAVEAGYGHAFSAVFDSNITTVIAGVVLMQYGTGPVRGFAVTLIVGILTSMFSALVVSRLIFDYFTNSRRLKSLSI